MKMKMIMNNQKKRQGKGLTSSKDPETINIQKPLIIWKQRLDILLTNYKYPEPVRKVI